MHHLSVAVTILRIPKSERVQIGVNPFSWLVNRGPDIWLVRVAHHGTVDHCATQGCKKGIIHDSSSRFPAALIEDILRRVGVDEATELRVADVWENVMVELKSKENKTSTKGD